MKFTISGYSTALFSTWYFIDELALLFDAGDGVISTLTQKSGKVKQIFISHADRDHLTGLLQFNQLNAREGYPRIYYPKNCGSFEALKSFSMKFDRQVCNTTWLPIGADEKIELNNNIHIESIENGHVIKPNGIKSLSYKIVEQRKKLKPKFQNLTKKEIKDIALEKGSEFLTETKKNELLGYSGDTPVEDFSRWENTRILIHEATFLNQDDIKVHGNAHSNLDQVLEMVANSNIEQLILGHFSARYSKNEIVNQIKKRSKHYNIKIPIYALFPGKSSFDILNQESVN